MNPDQGNNDPGQGCNDSGPGSGRGHKPPARRRRRNLPRRVVRNRMLEGMPKSRTVDGAEVQYDSYDDDDDHEDEQIDKSLLLAPRHELLVDRYQRPIIMPYNTIELQPQNPATKAINKAIKSKYQSAFQNWTEVKANKDAYNQFWNGFKSQVTWLREDRADIEEIFNKKSASTLRIEFIQAHDRAPTFMEMNDMLHKFADSGEWTGPKAQEVARSTMIFTEEYDAQQQKLPPHLRDNEMIRAMKISKAFVDYAGGRHRGRKFAAGSTSSLYQRDPNGLRDVSCTFYSSTGRSQPQRDETEEEFDARIRASVREELEDEVRKEHEENMQEVVDRQVDQRFQARWDEAVEAMVAVAQGQGSAQGSAQGSQAQQYSSNPPNNPSASQGYASSQEYRVPNFTNRQNIDLNQGMTEYAQGDVLQSVNFDDLGPLRRMLHDDEHFLLNSFPTGGRDKSNTQNFTPHQGNQQGCPVQSGWGQQRQVLPPIIINEGGGGRSRGRVVGRETNNRDKGIHVQLQPEPEDEYDEFSA